MAHFAKLSRDIETHPDIPGDLRRVLEVIVVDDAVSKTEAEGKAWLADWEKGRPNFYWPGIWVQCSFNHSIRQNFPGPGYLYSESLNAFVAEKPSNDVAFDAENAQWRPKILKPTAVWNPERRVYEPPRKPGPKPVVI